MKLLTTSQNLLDGLEKIGIRTSEELLNHLPYRYEDNSYTDLSALEDKQKITVLGKLVSNPKHIHTGKIDIITFFFVAASGQFFNVKIFNRGYLLHQLTLGEEYSVSGIFSLKNREINVQTFVKGAIPGEKKLRSVYHLPQSVSQNAYRKLAEKTLLTLWETLPDPLPEHLRRKYRLLERRQAIRQVHFPLNEADIASGLRTLKYHECLAYCLKNQIVRGENKRRPGTPKPPIDTGKINGFILSLGYRLTSDQIRAIREIIVDMNQQTLMYRLLQGDVGTGKTIVSAVALYGNYLRGRIGAFMVPTDSLARQQYLSLRETMEPFGIRVGLCIGAQSARERAEVRKRLLEGEIDIMVGTHALFSKDVEYPNLGLVIIDEQHRFGVRQRNQLLAKDDGCDLLLMSATPIPRTLALSIYGDLDISSLAEFPNKERKVATDVVSPESAKILATVQDCLSAQRQVFVVAPKITDTGNGKTSAEKLFEMYHAVFPSQVRILHGKMKSEEKNAILEDFIAGRFLILVSTTVIELGINVLNAGAILIYSASSFGLASLHQLRGRVGRNGAEAVCLLIDDNPEDERLLTLKENDDGFKIAEMDMKFRGPGDVIGTSQSGFPTFSCLNIVDDFRMFECARDDAYEILHHLENDGCRRYFDTVCRELETEEITLFD